jgi:hypothetical protein
MGVDQVLPNSRFAKGGGIGWSGTRPVYWTNLPALLESRSTIVSRASSFSVASLEEEASGSPETNGDPRILRASSWSGGFIGLAATPEDEANPSGEPILRMSHTLLLTQESRVVSYRPVEFHPPFT